MVGELARLYGKALHSKVRYQVVCGGDRRRETRCIYMRAFFLEGGIFRLFRESINNNVVRSPSNTCDVFVSVF